MLNFLIGLLIVLIVVLIYYLYTIYKNRNKNTNEKVMDRKEEFTNNKVDNSGNSNIMKMVIMIDGEEKEIVIKLFEDVVPLTCKNFKYISQKGINGKTYNGCPFHRIIKNFMIQGGDIVNQNGTGSVSIYGSNFEDENFKLTHDKPGLLSMANSGPNTNGSQFFITTVPTPHLDGKHVVFGEVINGMEVINEIENVPTDANDKPYKNIIIKSISSL